MLVEITNKKFKELKTTILGDKAEEYVRLRMVEIQPGITMEKVNPNGPHLYDYNVSSTSCWGDYKMEVKCYASRDCYPDSGVDSPDFDKYNKLYPLLLTFVDLKNQQVYANWMHSLSKKTISDGREYPWKQGAKVYFPLSHMKKIFDIPSLDVNMLLNECSTAVYLSYSSNNIVNITANTQSSSSSSLITREIIYIK